MADHTPTPWKVGTNPRYVEIWGGMRMNASPVLASLEHEPREANAAFIVKAVNNHDVLVQALQKAVAFYDGLDRLLDDGEAEVLDAMAAALKSALQEAGRS